MADSNGETHSRLTDDLPREIASKPAETIIDELNKQNDTSVVANKICVDPSGVHTPDPTENQVFQPTTNSDLGTPASLCTAAVDSGDISFLTEGASAGPPSSIDPTTGSSPTSNEGAPATLGSQAYLTLVEAIHLADRQPSSGTHVEPKGTLSSQETETAGAYNAASESVDTSKSDENEEVQLDLDIADRIRVDWLHPCLKLIAQAEKDYASNRHYSTSDNYLRGCLWAPDGSCILTNSRDNKLRIFNSPTSLLSGVNLDNTCEVEEMSPVLLMQENELVYDYAWYPSMNSNDPATCCFASSVRRNPIRLWDAFSGTVRAIYLPIGHLGDPISAFSIGFSSDGQRLYAGFNRFIHVFDVCRPGRDSTRRPKLGKKPQQGGIISCFAVPRDPSRHLYATGSYNGTVTIHSESDPAAGSVGGANFVARLVASPSGVSQVLFLGRLLGSSGAPWYLAAGCRRDPRIFLWDARKLRQPVAVLHRRVENYQRFQFDVEPFGRYLFTGSQTGAVCVYDLEKCLTDNSGTPEELSPPKCSSIWRAHADCAHGLSVHPSLSLVATASGQRRITAPLKRPGRRRGWCQSEVLSRPPEVGRSPPSSESSTTSDEEPDQAELTDEEAALFQPGLPPEADGCRIRSQALPLAGQLTRLPRENRLCLWAFPYLGSSPWSGNGID